MLVPHHTPGELNHNFHKGLSSLFKARRSTSRLTLPKANHITSDLRGITVHTNKHERLSLVEERIIPSDGLSFLV